MVNLIFQPYLRWLVIVFFDDILVYRLTFESHLQHLEVVFRCLLDNAFCLKHSKCYFS